MPLSEAAASTASHRGAVGLPPESLHAAFCAAFSDYVLGPSTLSLDGWPMFLARQGVDLSLSRAEVAPDGEVRAFALVAPRRATWRLATLGARPAVRGSGAAASLLADMLRRAAEAGRGAVELECFAQNPRALRLYERYGFVVVDELLGFEGERPAAVPAPLTSLTWTQALDWLDEAEAQPLALPLQQTRAGLAAATGLQAWSLGTALVMGAPAPDDPTVFSLACAVDRDASQRDLRALLGGLSAEQPRWTHWRAPQLLRPSVAAEALAAVGLQRRPLHQLWLRREL